LSPRPSAPSTVVSVWPRSRSAANASESSTMSSTVSDQLPDVQQLTATPQPIRHGFGAPRRFRRPRSAETAAKRTAAAVTRAARENGRMPSTLPVGDPAPADGALPASAAEGSAERDLGAYLHVPFCRVRCGYCDFNTYTASEIRGVKQSDYAEQASAEVAFARGVLADAGLA